MKKECIGYSTYGLVIDALVTKIKESNEKFDVIVAIPRGGLPVGVHLSHIFNLPFISTTDVDALRTISHYKNILLVDDINDTGTTLKFWSKILENHKVEHKTAVLFDKSHSEFKTNYSVEQTSNWIVFPWEREDEKPNRERYKHL